MAELKIVANYDLRAVAEAVAALKANDGYCPCALERNEDTKCMCKEFRESQEEGVCHCGRYRKIKFVEFKG